MQKHLYSLIYDAICWTENPNVDVLLEAINYVYYGGNNLALLRRFLRDNGMNIRP